MGAHGIFPQHRPYPSPPPPPPPPPFQMNLFTPRLLAGKKLLRGALPSGVKVAVLQGHDEDKKVGRNKGARSWFCQLPWKKKARTHTRSTIGNGLGAGAKTIV